MRTATRLNFFLSMTLAALALSASAGVAIAAPAQVPTGVTRIILLGTNGGPRPYPVRAEPANLLVVNGIPYLIDAGEGVAGQIA